MTPPIYPSQELKQSAEELRTAINRYSYPDGPAPSKNVYTLGVGARSRIFILLLQLLPDLPQLLTVRTYKEYQKKANQSMLNAIGSAEINAAIIEGWNYIDDSLERPFVVTNSMMADDVNVLGRAPRAKESFPPTFESEVTFSIGTVVSDILREIDGIMNALCPPDNPSNV